MPQPERDEVHAEQDVLLVELIVQDLLGAWLSPVQPRGVCLGHMSVVDIVIVDASQVAAVDLPPGQVLVAAGVERGLVVGIKLDAEDGKVARVPVRKGPLLPPDEYLDREASVHADRDYLLAIIREYQVEDSSFVLRGEHDEGLQRLRVPDMDGGVHVDLAGGGDPEERVLGNCRDFEFVALVEGLCLATRIVHHPNTRRVVQNILLASSVNAVVFDRLLLLQQVLVVCPQDAG